MRQILEALEYLADRRIIHRDIKPSNILISGNHCIKIADFGLARSATQADGREGKIDMTNNVVTMWYKAPELLLGSQRYSYAIDVWSVGCVLAELLLLRPLFPGKTEVEQLDCIFRTLGSPTEDEWPELSTMPFHDKLFKNAPKFSKSSFRDVLVNDDIPEACISLLERIFVKDPSRRCSARTAISSRYFLTVPVAPEDPAELLPLMVSPETSLHEFETKQRRRQKEKYDKAQKELQLAPPPPPAAPVPPPGAGNGTGYMVQYPPHAPMRTNSSSYSAQIPQQQQQNRTPSVSGELHHHHHHNHKRKQGDRL